MATSAASAVDVYLEVGAKRVFASALDWPGWSRAGKDEAAALAALAAAAARYQVVPREAGITFPTVGAEGLKVVERVKGTATTDFGAPGVAAGSDARPLAGADAKRLGVLLAAAWKVFDRVVAAAPADLRKGPRGGGRDREKMLAHVVDAEGAYVGKIGLKLKAPDPHDSSALAAFREEIIAVISTPETGQDDSKAWRSRYAARRFAWHLLDHAWEIEDRTEK